MGAAYTGALIVIEQDMVLEEYEKTGITVDGAVYKPAAYQYI